MSVDKDVLAVLKTMAAPVEEARLAKLKAKHNRLTQRQVETQLELLADVVEQVIPRTHPLFNAVLLETAILKVSQEHEQPEDESFLGEDW
jgi:serine phosphatase RsbU (regulator of sigma subunit)